MGLLGAVIEQAWSGDPQSRSLLCIVIAEALLNVRHGTMMQVVNTVDVTQQAEQLRGMPLARWLGDPKPESTSMPLVPGGHRTNS